MIMRYKILEHPADLKLEVKAPKIEELFLNLAWGICEVMVPKLNQFPASGKRIIKAQGKDKESLLVNFLNEIIYLSDAEREIYRNFKIKRFQPNKFLEVVAEVVKPKRKEVEIKAATYHDLEILKKNNHWQAVVVFDI